jgi:hypothetical protein
MAKTKGTPRPKTGEPRKTKQPLLIDLLPVEVRDTILFLHNTRGKSFEDIAAYSAEPVGPGKLGFIRWSKLPPDVLAQFPERRLARTTLHRWHDLRFAQDKKDIYARSAMAREIADAFSKSVVEGGNGAVLAAARDTFMIAMSEDPTAAGRARAAKSLIALAEVMQTARANDIKERKVAVDERKLKAMEERERLSMAKLRAEADKLKRKAKTGKVTPEDMDRVYERVFGPKPAPTEAAA